MSAQQMQQYHVKEGGKQNVDRTTQALTPVFLGDPVFTWLLHDMPPSKRKDALYRMLSAFFSQAGLNNGIFIEVADYGSCGVLMPPGTRMENPWTLISAGLIPMLWNVGLGYFKRAFLEYGDATEPMKKKTFTKEEQKKHWYLFIMGTAEDRQRQGLGSSLLAHTIDRARSDGRPVWLEATTAYSRDLYLKRGFELGGDVTLGKGDVGADGVAKKGGEGVTIWGMFWRPRDAGQ